MAARVRQLVTASLMGIAFAFGSNALGQAPNQNADEDNSAAIASARGNYEGALLISSLLPNQVSGVTEIMGLGGIRGGMRLNQTGWLEGSLSMGNGSGQEWRNLDADARMDIPVENLVGLAYVGLDLTQFSGPGNSTTFNFGGHVGGGIQGHLGGDFWARSDMKFGFSPGVTLTISLGLVWRFGDAAQGGGG